MRPAESELYKNRYIPVQSGSDRDSNNNSYLDAATRAAAQLGL